MTFIKINILDRNSSRCITVNKKQLCVNLPHCASFFVFRQYMLPIRLHERAAGPMIGNKHEMLVVCLIPPPERTGFSEDFSPRQSSPLCNSCYDLDRLKYISLGPLAGELLVSIHLDVPWRFPPTTMQIRS
uniref:Uncharacterized protein n=1 Tax=Schistosoma curassoni TaxID=6186 RepID=A0A183JPY9_9TREM